MRNCHRLLVLFLLFATTAGAQNLVKAEYFIDIDPGVGAAVDVPVTAAPAISNFSFSPNLNSLTEGTHQLYFRIKDANGRWSTTERNVFYKLTFSSTPPPSPVSVTAAEYFVDSDPGATHGTAINISSGLVINNQAFAIDQSALTNGLHHLYVRFRDANGRWSTTESNAFYKLTLLTQTSLPPANITAAEYFIDADPGFGAATAIAITPGQSVANLLVSKDVASLSQGNHVLYLRFKDANGRWSVPAGTSFSVCNGAVPVSSAATSISSTGFAANWNNVVGASSYQLDVSTDNFQSFVNGYSSLPVTAPTISYSVAGLLPAASYQFRVRAVASCASVSSTAINVATLATPPTAQPNSLVFSAVTSTSLGILFTPAGQNTTGYVVIRKAGSVSTFVPANNTTYSAGQTTSDGNVAYVGTVPQFAETALTPNTHYYYSVFAYDQQNGFTTYLNTNPLSNNIFTLATEPASPPTSLQFSSVASTSFTVNIIPSGTAPDGYLVLRRTAAAPTLVPNDATTYTGTQGSDVVVSNGPATSFTQTGLTQNTSYYYLVYPFNGSNTSTNYLITSPLQGSQLTPITPPSSAASNMIFTNVTPNGLTVSFSAAGAPVNGYLVIRSTSATTSFVPQPNTTYSGTLPGGEFVAFNGASTSFSDAGLQPSTVYYYYVFAYNQNGTLISYQTAAPLENSKATFTGEPTAQPTALSFLSITPSSLTLSFINANPAAGGYLVLRKTTSTPTATPVDGTSYAVGNVLSDGSVIVSASSATTVNDAGLLAGTMYYYIVFSFNGSGNSTNFLTTTASNTGSVITIPAKPVGIAATLIQQDRFQANWNQVLGALNYKLDVSSDNFQSLIINDQLVSNTFYLVTGLLPGTAYQYRVRAVDASGTSVSSDPIQLITVPKTPSIETSTLVGQTTVTINWDYSANATGYVLDVFTNSNLSSPIPGSPFTVANTSGPSISPSQLLNGLTAGIYYYFQVRSYSQSGTSPNSAPASQLLIAANPTASTANNNPTTTSFVANWDKVPGIVTEYRIDVSLQSDNFGSLLTDYNDLPVRSTDGSDPPTFILIKNLQANTPYIFRVRAVNATGTSGNYNAQPVTTAAVGSTNPLQITSPEFPATFTGTTIKASTTVSGGLPPYVVTFNSRAVTAVDYKQTVITSPDGTSYSADITGSMFDQIGLDFFFSVTDATTTAKGTSIKYIYLPVVSDGQRIPFTKYGGTKDSYELFSIPYQLNDNLIATIFDELGAYDKSKWRLVRYQNEKNVDYGDGLNRIELGKSYWFNSKANVPVSFSGGTTPQYNQASDFVLSLESGWNQIGNPFPFNVDWNDIVSLSSDQNDIGKLKVFNPSQFDLSDDSNNLATWSGGFVFNSSTQTIQMKMPVTLKNTAGGRIADNTGLASDLNSPDWFVPLTITQDNVSNRSTGFGMNSTAVLSKDRFDEIVVPRFLNYIEFFSLHSDFFAPRFSKDVVPPAETKTWDFNYESNLGGQVQIKWDNQSLGTNSAQLLLFDAASKSLVDMKKFNAYSFTPGNKNSFRVFYSADGKHLSPDLVTTLNAWPNPFRLETNLSFFVEDSRSAVSVSVLDLQGRPVGTIANGNFEPGIYTVQWSGQDSDGSPVSSGVYLVRTAINGKVMISKIIKL